MSNALQVELGAVDVQVDGVDVGHQKGGAEVTYEPEFVESAVDAYGGTAIEAYLKGERLTAKVRFAEYTIDNLRKAMPQTQFAGAANARITIGAKAGKKASDDSVELTLHPSTEGTRKHDVVLYKAVAISSIVLPHTNEDDKIIEVEFLALIDESKSDGNYLGLIGDSTA